MGMAQQSWVHAVERDGQVGGTGGNLEGKKSHLEDDASSGRVGVWCLEEQIRL